MASNNFIAGLLVCSVSLVAIVQAQPQAPAKPPVPASQASPSPPGMTNQDVIELVRNGFGEDLVVSQIQAAKNKTFDTTTKGLISLKTAGVSERIITVMTGSPDPGKPAIPSSAAVSAATSVEAAPIVPEVGVYYKRESDWVDLLPEIVNWKTGGFLKKVATLGIVNRDMNGVLQRPSSKTVLKWPVEILIYAGEGVAITEYQLLRFRLKKDSREFRTMTGGVFNSSGGSQRDTVPFESRKIGLRTYTLVLPNLTPGEYGILAPGAIASTSAAAQLGKAFTFRLE